MTSVLQDMTDVALKVIRGGWVKNPYLSPFPVLYR